jgi:prepilin-type N-terminal cleavage/methylation domain-containing protein/prepilin-type processing-associated H-X9-DG protein
MHACTSLRAFTLIELLIVLAIIAGLVGLVVPVAGYATSAARTLKCLSNLRQIGIACVAYADDNRDAVVPTLERFDGQNFAPTGAGYAYWHWYELLQPYVEYEDQRLQGANTGSDVWRRSHGLNVSNSNTERRTVLTACPASIGRRKHEWHPGSGYTSLGLGRMPYLASTSTALCGPVDDFWWAPPTNRRLFRLSAVSYPSSRAYVGDSSDWHLCYDTGADTWLNFNDVWVPIEQLRQQDRVQGADPLRHRGKANYLYIDAHAATLSPRQARNAMFRPDQPN